VKSLDKIYKFKWSGCTLLICILILSLKSPVRITQDAEEPKYSGTMIIQNRAEPPHFNLGISMAYGMEPACNIYESLVSWDYNVNPHPELAESWEISPDYKTFTFHLRHDITWHDGEPFTSADVKFTIEEVLIPHNPMGKLAFLFFESIVTPDDYTVVFQFKMSRVFFMVFLNPVSAPMLPKHLYENTDIMKNPYNEKPVGTGPFRLAEWVKGDHVTLVRNENYYDKRKPYLDKLIFKTMPKAETALAALENKEIDVLTAAATGMLLHEVPRLEAAGFKTSWHGWEYWKGTPNLVFNTIRPITGDIKVRQSIAHALDTEQITKLVGQGYYVVSRGTFPSTMPYYKPDVKQYPYDPEKANELLNEAGYPKDSATGVRFKLNLISDATIPSLVKASEIVKAQLKEVGIDVEMLPLEVGTLIARETAGNFDLIMELGTMGPDPSTYWAYHYHSRFIRVPFGNMAFYTNSRVDLLLDMATVNVDTAKLKEYYYEIQDIVAEELPSLLFYETRDPWVFSPDFGGVIPPGPNGGYQSYKNAYWIKGQEQIAPSPVWVWEVIVAIVVVVAVAAAVAVIVRRRRTQAQ